MGKLGRNLRICGEVDLPIHLHLLSTKRNHHNIKEIVAHQQALAQSRMFLESKFPKAILTPVASNGVGAQMAASEEGVACIAGSMASELYSLDIVYENIEDRCNNTTRFLIVGSDLIPPSGVDKTSIIVTTHNESGALYRLLKPFHDANVNLTRIDTRPAENEKWCYVFFIEFEGHYQDDAIQNILDILTQYSQQLKILGSYPKAVF